MIVHPDLLEVLLQIIGLEFRVAHLIWLGVWLHLWLDLWLNLLLNTCLFFLYLNGHRELAELMLKL